ncbi:hypothetical protein [Streptomyces sp. 6N106]|uniref:hypothetical protein n=1 Tax=Streptomyces sp. 6N106 TaxID=3457418 RepID=UPI003FD24184
MATPLATTADVEARLGRALDPDEVPEAEAALKAASAKVRFYGLPWPDPATAPDIAIVTALDVVERKMRNPEGFRSEMEGGYQYARPASDPTGTELKTSEIKMLQAAAGLSGIYSVPIASLGGDL